jgi:protein-S-isoprenylcysteine O-methyltransferase Ste14
MIVASALPSTPSLELLCRLGTPSHDPLSPLFILGTFLAATGGWIRLRCYQEMGQMFTFEMTILKNHRLVTSGPYNIVRHPAYTGAVSTMFGITLWHASSVGHRLSSVLSSHMEQGSWARSSGVLNTWVGLILAAVFGSLAGCIVLGLLRRMPKEDKVLRELFPTEWDEWRSRVPCKLIPGVL